MAWRHAINGAERSAAVAALVEVLDQYDDPLGMLPDLALLSELQLACGQDEAAADSASRLAAMSAGDIGHALTGYACLAASVAAMAVVMNLNADPDASLGLTTGFLMFAVIFIGLAVALYRPLFHRGGHPPGRTVPERAAF